MSLNLWLFLKLVSFKSCENIDVEEDGPYVIILNILSASVNLLILNWELM